MRVSEDERDFANFFLDVGNATMSPPSELPRDSVVFPREMVCTKMNLISFVLPSVRNPDRNALILFVRNSDVDRINRYAASLCPGTEKTYLSSDNNEHDVPASTGTRVQREFRHDSPIENLIG